MVSLRPFTKGSSHDQTYNTLSDERHLALQETALKKRKSITSLIEESVGFYGIKTQQGAKRLVAKARKRTGLSWERAIDLAVEETRMARGL